LLLTALFNIVRVQAATSKVVVALYTWSCSKGRDLSDKLTRLIRLAQHSDLIGFHNIIGLEIFKALIVHRALYHQFYLGNKKVIVFLVNNYWHNNLGTRYDCRAISWGLCVAGGHLTPNFASVATTVPTSQLRISTRHIQPLVVSVLSSFSKPSIRRHHGLERREH
jgi:hypothetical protein